MTPNEAMELYEEAMKKIQLDRGSKWAKETDPFGEHPDFDFNDPQFAEFWKLQRSYICMSKPVQRPVSTNKYVNLVKK